MFAQMDVDEIQDVEQKTYEHLPPHRLLITDTLYHNLMRK